MDEELKTTTAADDIQEYLIFTVASIDFGIDIGLVQEIIKLQPISPIPNALDFCKGIINIRGNIVPVLDMRAKLGFETAEYQERTCIIVVKLESETIGVIVDMVQDVIRISEREQSDFLINSYKGTENYTSKIASVNGKIRQILDVDAVFQTGAC